MIRCINIIKVYIAVSENFKNSIQAADFILEDVRQKVDSLEQVKSANVNLVFEPVWDQSMMTEEAKVELGFD